MSPIASTRGWELARCSVGAALLAAGLWSAVEGVSGLAYLLGLYESFGFKLWLLIGALAGLIVLAVRPLVGVALSLLRCRFPRALGPFAAGSVLLLAGQALWSNHQSKLQPVNDLIVPASTSGLQKLAEFLAELPAPRQPFPLSGTTISYCESPPADRRLTVFATFLARFSNTESQSLCLQGGDWPTLLAQLRRALATRGLRGPVKIDIVSGTQGLEGSLAWLDPLKLRPGLDGLCIDARCLMPWQLLSQDVFGAYRPLDFLRDFQVGIVPSQLRSWLASAPGDNLSGMTRITTRSYVVSPQADGSSGVLALRRLRPLRPTASELTAPTLRRTVSAAERYLLGSQKSNGMFQYSLMPFSGKLNTTTLSLPRQAGTTLVLCQLGSETEKVSQAIAQSLGFLDKYRRSVGAMDVYTAQADERRAHLGYTALALLALTECTVRLGEVSNYKAIGRAAKTLLALQREDGSFSPWLVRPTGTPGLGPQPLYAPGQAIGALLAVEQLQSRAKVPTLPPLGELSRAVAQAMYYVVTSYWQHPLADYFFLEENWHCLAARMALTVHPNSAYEQFCLDYVSFKTRLMLRTDNGVAPEFDGGFGLGNLVAPHNTATAGLAEAVAAALAISQFRGDASLSSALTNPLRRLLAYLVRQQWTSGNCFACRDLRAVGGISEYIHSSKIRVDFVQHTWAAMGHGGRQLGLLASP